MHKDLLCTLKTTCGYGYFLNIALFSAELIPQIFIQGIESPYFEGLSIMFANLREERSNCLQHYIDLRSQFDVYLKRPDERNSQLKTFVSEYNSVSPEVRCDEAARAEWALRCNELVEDVWEACDTRKEENDLEISQHLQTNFLSENSSLIESLFVEGVQIELDRSVFPKL